MKVAVIVGARPQYVKAYPVISSFLKKNISYSLIDSGQHYDHNLSDVFYKEFNINEPDYYLGVGGGTHGFMTGKMLIEIEKVLLMDKPDYVVIFGDTNTTLAGALAASKLNIKIIHIESGLRSYNDNMPEETNRRIADHLSTYLFCPTQKAVDNLALEGLKHQDAPFYPNIYNVGDVMVDALLSLKNKHVNSGVCCKYKDKEYILTTVHRAESTDDIETLTGIFKSLLKLSNFYEIVMPLHPRTRSRIVNMEIYNEILTNRNLNIIEPLSYSDFIYLLDNSFYVITDSGGVQKESLILGVPCITLRNETEWTETITTGWNTLAGRNPANLLDIIKNNNIPEQCCKDIYGDGNAADRITNILFDL